MATGREKAILGQILPDSVKITHTLYLMFQVYIVPYKMKIWHRIYFGELQKSVKLNMLNYNSIRQY